MTLSRLNPFRLPNVEQIFKHNMRHLEYAFSPGHPQPFSQHRDSVSATRTVQEHFRISFFSNTSLLAGAPASTSSMRKNVIILTTCMEPCTYIDASCYLQCCPWVGRTENEGLTIWYRLMWAWFELKVMVVHAMSWDILTAKLSKTRIQTQFSLFSWYLQNAGDSAYRFPKRVIGFMQSSFLCKQTNQVKESKPIQVK